MSVIATALRHMLAAGMPHDAIVAAVEAMENACPRDAQAESRREKDRLRKRNVRGIPQTSAESAETADSADKAPPPLDKEVSPTPPSRKLNSTPESICGDGEKPPTALPEPKGKSEFLDLAERLWACHPVIGGKRRSTRPDTSKALETALKRGGKPGEIELAFSAYYALPGSTKSGGEFAMGAARLLERDRWKEFAPAAVVSVPLVVWPGPADLRAEIALAEGDGFALNYVDRSGWIEKPERKIVARNGYAARQLEQQVGPILRRHGVGVQIQAAA